MTPEAILSLRPKHLSQDERTQYFQKGYVVARNALAGVWLRKARSAYESAVERSRQLTASNRWFSIAPEHSPEDPCIYRVERLPDQDDEFWAIAEQSPLADIATDILGPDIIYRDSMINVKPPGARGAVAWHQDFAFYPHTNYGTIQILTALYDITDDQGPLCVLPGSNHGQIYDHYDENDQWLGEIPVRTIETIDVQSQIKLVCKAGDAVLLHPATIHGSQANKSGRARPLLIHGLNAADAIPYTALTWGNSHTGDSLRGQPQRYAHHDSIHVRLPPDWSTGYSSIFEHQQDDAD